MILTHSRPYRRFRPKNVFSYLTVKNRFYASARLIGLKLEVLTISPTSCGSIAHSGSLVASIIADRVANSRKKISRRYIFLIFGKYASILLLSFCLMSIFYDYMLQIRNYIHYCWFSDENVLRRFRQMGSKFFLRWSLLNKGELDNT